MVMPMMPAVRPVIADSARTIVRQDEAAATIGMIVIGRGVIGPVVVGPVKVPMVVRESVTAVAEAATVRDMRGAETSTLERWRGAETASAEMHAASAMATSAKVHSASTVATSAEVSAAATAMTTAPATMAVNWRGQAFRGLPSHTGSAGIDQ